MLMVIELLTVAAVVDKIMIERHLMLHIEMPYELVESYYPIVQWRTKYDQMLDKEKFCSKMRACVCFMNRISQRFEC
jgi:hypothetical protein